METCIKCNASRTSLVAALEQRSLTGWHTIAFASCFLNCKGESYSVNDLRLLGTVYSVECFKFYFHQQFFFVISDHKAIFSIMKEQ